MARVAFVAGATGHVGREVVRAAVEAGARTVAHVRPDAARLEEWRARFRTLGAVVDTTPWEAEPMAAALRAHAPTEVYALLGTTKRRAAGEGRSAEEAYERVDYGLTVLLLEALKAAGCAGARFVYLSAQGASGGARAGYFGARVRVEEALRASGLPYTIARPSWIIGERDESRPGEKVGAALTDAVLSVAGLFGARALEARHHSTTNDVLARALVRVAADPAYENRAAEGAALRDPP